MANKEIFDENLRDLLKERGFKDVFKQAIKMLKPSKLRLIIIIVVVCIVAYPISTSINSNNTVENILKTLDLSNDIVKDLFGITFTGYALFQALLGANSLKRMLIAKIGKHSAIKRFNLYFFILNLMYLSLIFLNYLLIIIFNICDFNSISLILSYRVKFIMEYIFIIIYIGIILFAISEMKSFIFNLYHCFNLSIFSEGIEISKEIATDEEINKNLK